MARDSKTVAELRAMTGAGIVDCKKALDETGGDMQKAMRNVFYSEFEKRNGVKIVNTSPPDLGKLKAMVDGAKIVRAELG